MDNLKKIATRTGIVLTGLFGIVLLGGGKIQSGTLLIATTFAMALPVRRPKLPRWARIGLICAVFGVVMWNVSTTELPNSTNDSSFSSNVAAMSCDDERVDISTSTGFKLLDATTYIFGGFLAQAAPS